MICRHCGKNIPADSELCPECGAKVKAEKFISTPSSFSTAAAPKKKKKGIGCAIVAIIVVLALVGGVLILTLGGKSESSYEEAILHYIEEGDYETAIEIYREAKEDGVDLDDISEEVKDAYRFRFKEMMESDEISMTDAMRLIGAMVQYFAETQSETPDMMSEIM